MDDLGCPRCKTTKYRNPQLKLMVNICGHALCDSCIEYLFVKGAASCLECGTTLRRSNFRLQLFEDSAVEKEVDIRKRILRDYNKQEEDFASLLEYNDYLEEVESIIFNLANGIDAADTKRKIEQYKKENKDQILRNKSKGNRDEVELDELIEMEKQINDAAKQQLLIEEKQMKTARMKNKEELIDNLMFSDKSASDIVASHQNKMSSVQEIKKSAPPLPTKFSTGINIKEKSFLPIVKANQHELYRYSEQVIDFIGPDPPSLEVIKTNDYLLHIRQTTDDERSGGFVTDISCHRALQEAFSGLFFSKVCM